MKKIIALALTLVMIFALAVPAASADDAKEVKAGFIFLHDENSTYDLNFINAAKEAEARAEQEREEAEIKQRQDRFLSNVDYCYSNPDEKKQFMVADPDCTNPMANGPYYKVDKFRLIHSILLGVMTYDGNILVVEKK